MIPMRMRYEQMRFDGFPVIDEIVSETSDTSACVKNNEPVIIKTKFLAWCISSITNRLFAWSWN